MPINRDTTLQTTIAPAGREAGALTNQQLPPGLLLPVSGDDFLPTPGAWTRALGIQLLTLLLLGAGALAVWPMRETVRAVGVVRPDGENTLVQSERGGRLAQVLIQPNQSVTAGQVLARFDNQPMEAERRQLNQELATLEAQARKASQEQVELQSQAASLGSMTRSITEASRRAVEQARTQLAFEQREVERYRVLLQSGAVPRNLLDQQEAKQLMSGAEVMKAMQGVSEQQARGATELARLRQSASQASSAADELRKQALQRRARLQQVERELLQGTVRSPLSGSVVSTPLRHAGQVLEPGAVLAVVAPVNHRLRVQAQVAADAISQVRPGQQATLRVSACPTSEFGVVPARVRSVSADTLPAAGSADAAPARGYGIELDPARRELTSAQGRCALRLGMEIRADVVTRRTTVLAFLLNKLRISD
jgi:HlyD family secretion protein